MPSFLFLDCAAIIRVDADLRMNSTMEIKTHHERKIPERHTETNLQNVFLFHGTVNSDLFL